MDVVWASKRRRVLTGIIKVNNFLPLTNDREYLNAGFSKEQLILGDKPAPYTVTISAPVSGDECGKTDFTAVHLLLNSESSMRKQLPHRSTIILLSSLPSQPVHVVLSPRHTPQPSTPSLTAAPVPMDHFKLKL